MRRIAVVLVAGLLVGAFAGAGWAQTEPSSVQIREVDLSSFPVLTLTVALQTAEDVAPQSIQVMENGKPVASPAIQAFGQEGQSIDVVLVIDTSGSMEGQPMASAISAAKSFLRGARSSSDLAVGLLAFSDTPKVVQRITTNLNRVRDALDTLEASGETALYDGVVAASNMFRGAAQRNIIVLSDGGDTVSTGKLRSVTNAAKVADATIFTIGLESGEFDAAALKSMSRRSGGTYSTATPEDLAAVYQQVLSALTQQFLITYRSQGGKGSSLKITVTAPQGTDSVTVRAPRPVAPAAPPPSPVPKGPPDQSALERFFGSDWALGAVLAVCFVAAFLFIAMVLSPLAQARRERELGKRVGVVAETKESEERNLSSFLPVLVSAGNRLAEASGYTLALERLLERAGLSFTPGEVVAGSIILLFVGAVFGGYIMGGAVSAILFAALFAAAPYGYLLFSIRKRSNALRAQLPDILMILASSLRAGHSFLQAVDTVSREAGDPGGKEFARVVAEIRLGRPVDETMNALADRVGSDDFKWAVLAVNVQREVGGNLAEVLDTVAETLREREVVRRQVDTLSIEGKLSMYILIALPIFIGFYIWRVNPEYLSLLFEPGIGLIMLIGAAAMMVVGFIWMRKIVSIDV